MNTQTPEKKSSHGPESLDVHSMFYTIQGEGPFSGYPAYFIRLAGCNLQCPQCDTEYTQGRERWAVPAILSKLRDGAAMPPQCKLVVITGGEPFRQDLSHIIPELCNRGLIVQIETNGTLGPHADFVRENRHRLAAGSLSIVCSPKTGAVNQTVQQMIYFQLRGGYKYLIDAEVVCDGNTGLPFSALNHPNAPRLWHPDDEARVSLQAGGSIFVSPVDTQDDEHNKRNIRRATAIAMKHGYRLSLQIHKIIGVE